MIINYLFYLQIKPCVVDGWVDGWMDGSESRFKDCLQQSKMSVNQILIKIDQFGPIFDLNRIKIVATIDPMAKFGSK